MTHPFCRHNGYHAGYYQSRSNEPNHKIYSTRKNEIDQLTEFKIQETFLDFFRLTDHSAGALTRFVLNILKQNQIDIRKCVSQGHDGANVEWCLQYK